MKKMIDSRDFYAIGEIGIDLYWDQSFLKQQQQDAFQTEIHWAIEKELPIVIHCRDAFDQIFKILKTEKDDNISRYIIQVIDKLVDIHGLTFEEIANITTQNSKDAFGI